MRDAPSGPEQYTEMGKGGRKGLRASYACGELLLSGGGGGGGSWVWEERVESRDLGVSCGVFVWGCCFGEER